MFLSRAFRHTSIVIAPIVASGGPPTSKAGEWDPEYQLTASVWARALLEDDFGVAPADIVWVRGGVEQAGRIEKARLNLPPGLQIEPAPAGCTLARLLEEGAIDGIIGPRLPSCFGQPGVPVGWLFPDPVQAASDYFARTGIFPIMHVLGVRRALAERHPWLPGTLAKAFEESKAVALAQLADTSATKVTLPFVEDNLRAARRLLGPRLLVLRPRGPIATCSTWFLNHHHRQGLSSQHVTVPELFLPPAGESHRI